METVRFKCNLKSVNVGGPKRMIRFQAHVFETSDIDEIKYLDSFGARHGVVIEEATEDEIVVVELESSKEQLAELKASGSTLAEQEADEILASVKRKGKKKEDKARDSEA